MLPSRDKGFKEIVEKEDAQNAASRSLIHPSLLTLAQLLSQLCAQDLLQPPERSAPHDEDNEA